LLVAQLSEYEDTRSNASRALLLSQFHDLKEVDDFLLRVWNDNAWVRKKEVREVQRATVRALEKLIQISNPIDLCELLLEFWLYQARDEEEQVLLYELLAHWRHGYVQPWVKPGQPGVAVSDELMNFNNYVATKVISLWTR
jgi:hypothetical protein